MVGLQEKEGIDPPDHTGPMSIRTGRGPPCPGLGLQESLEREKVRDRRDILNELEEKVDELEEIVHNLEYRINGLRQDLETLQYQFQQYKRTKE
jgi:TolA-binding protein